MPDIVSRLKADVEQQTTLIHSLITLVTGIAQRIRDTNANYYNVDELNGIADELEQNSTVISNAVLSNTEADAMVNGPGLAAPIGVTQQDETPETPPASVTSGDAEQQPPVGGDPLPDDSAAAQQPDVAPTPPAGPAPSDTGAGDAAPQQEQPE